ncbi:MAG: DNA polymerase IV [Acidobacteria bacterium]|nr:DNA polymerase IV [Acidobacteriota bacterium]
MRKIIHVDMDAFYASVEQRDDPSLAGRPVVVGANAPRGVVAAASYEARAFGVRSAMPSVRAARLCPDAVWIRPRFDRYREVSLQIREIFERHTDLIEPLGLDEAYLDVTVEKTGIATATETAEVIRREIRETTGLTASAGVAANKFLAKIASDWKKPDGLFVIKPHQVERFLEHLDVRRLPGVGRKTEERLKSMNILEVRHLRELDEDELTERFGSFGRRLWQLARGIDDRPVNPSRIRKSMSSENTYSRDLTLEEVRETMNREIDRVWSWGEKRGMFGRTIVVKLRSADFTTLTRQSTRCDPPATLEEFRSRAQELLGAFPFGPETRFRLAGVGMSGFDEALDPQEPLPFERREDHHQVGEDHGEGRGEEFHRDDREDPRREVALTKRPE